MSQGGKAFTIDDVDTLVAPADPISEKIVHLVAKYKTLDECMSAVQKAYDKDAISLEEFLKCIRQLSNKQCKQMWKMNKIYSAMNPGQEFGQREQFRGYQM